MSKYGQLLVVAGMARAVMECASRHGIDVHFRADGMGDAAGHATQLNSMVAAEDDTFKEVVSRAVALGELDEPCRMAKVKGAR